MKRLFIAAQWIGVVFLAVSLFMYVFRRDPPPDHDPRTWSAWGGFHALVVEGVTDSDNPRYVSPERLEEQMAALKQAGYVTITPEDVQSYFYQDQPLPEKALLLLFEGGRKDQVVRVTPRLIRNRWIGVLCVPTEVTRKWSGHFVGQADLRRLARSPNWHVASMGNEAVESIRVDESGNKGRFLSRREWSRHGVERDAEFEDRLLRDYRDASRILAKAAGVPPALYFYPYGDAAAGFDADPLAELINRGAVREFHKLAFTQEGRPFNAYASDPYALSSMSVRGDWSGEELVRILSQWTPDVRPVAGVPDSSRWQMQGVGEFHSDRAQINSLASLLLRGSGVWGDLVLSAEIEPSPGAAAEIYLRYSGPHSYVRVSVKAGGIRIEEKRAGRLQTLLKVPLDVTGGERCKLSIRLKNNRLWVDGNDRNIADALVISGMAKQGSVVLSAQGGAISVADVSCRPIPELYVTRVNYDDIGNDLRDRASAVFPVWFTSDAPYAISEREQISIVEAANEGIETIPLFETGHRYSMEEAREAAKKITSAMNAISVRMLIQRLAVTGYQPELHKAFAEQGIAVDYVLSPESGMRELDRGIVPGRAERFIVEGSQQQVRALLDRYDSKAPPYRLAVEVGPDDRLPTGVAAVIGPRVPGSDTF